ncbi:hypothetical protein EBR43_09340 [bacterium]|nr:hypothetical protein [bacterium]NBW57962.1 hypothetical protein [bacterium]
MKQKLTGNYIINLMREEWQKKVNSLLSETPSQKKKPRGLKMQVDVDGDGSKENVIDVGLKVQKKMPDDKRINVKGDPTSGLVYTVVSVNDQDKTITLSRPDSSNGEKTIVITKQAFENEYQRK